jgi:hypothetical protein
MKTFNEITGRFLYAVGVCFFLAAGYVAFAVESFSILDLFILVLIAVNFMSNLDKQQSVQKLIYVTLGLLTIGTLVYLSYTILLNKDFSQVGFYVLALTTQMFAVTLRPSK